MGTRHLILVLYKGVYHIAQYGQWDGYPEGQGVQILAFIQDEQNIAKLKASIDNNLVYQPSERECAEWDRRVHELEEQRRASGNPSGIMSGPLNEICPSLSRDTSAKILSLVANTTVPIPIQRDLEFATDDLFCEWMYVVDLDLGTFEVFSSTYKDRENVVNDRFAEPNHGVTSTIPPCGIWNLNRLPSGGEFLKRYSREDGEEDSEES